MYSRSIIYNDSDEIFHALLMPLHENFLLIHLKVALIQKGLVDLSFLQADEPNYFPILNFFHSKWLKENLNEFKGGTLMKKVFYKRSINTP